MLLSVFAFIVTLSICVQEYDANPSSINSDKSRVTSLNPEDMEVLANSPAGLRSGWKSHDRQQRRLMVGQTDDLTRPKALVDVGNSLFTIDEEIMDVNKKLPQPEAEPHLPVKKMTKWNTFKEKDVHILQNEIKPASPGVIKESPEILQVPQKLNPKKLTLGHRLQSLFYRCFKGF
ncbi:hypothetical protein Plhal304r1_c022g0078301 [Plasmopara halstedii]